MYSAHSRVSRHSKYNTMQIYIAQGNALHFPWNVNEEKETNPQISLFYAAVFLAIYIIPCNK
jgi:hypothetical protein